ncbi:dimethyl sulfoxide reductase anchor subunit family protein [Photobacterium sp. DNB22_13_2]
MSDLSLVFFTVLAQSTVGVFITLGLVELGAKPNKKAMNLAFVAPLVLLAIAAMASVTHLGQPLRMLNVMFGLKHASALSLEIVALSLFGGAAAAYAAMRWFGRYEAYQKWCLMAAMLFGLTLIAAITNVYTLDTVPVWNSKWTFFQFLMTAGVAGPVGAAALLRWHSDKIGDSHENMEKVLGLVFLAALFISILGYVGYLFWLGHLDVAGNPLMMMGYHPKLAVLRILLLMAGLTAAAVSALRGSKQTTWVTLVCFITVITAELLGRVFFFDIYINASSGL